MKIYVAEYRFGNPSIFSVEVIKETEKSYIVDGESKETLLGSFTYVNKRVPKTISQVYGNLSSVVMYLKNMANLSIVRYEKEIKRAKEVLVELDEFLGVE